MKIFLFILGWMLCFPLPARADEPAPGNTALLMQTEAGPLLLGLYTHEAPETTAQIMSLARRGLYDHVLISRIDPGYLFQVGEVWTTDALRPPSLWTKIPKLPLEARGLHHVPRVLSLAHADGNPDSGQSSFSVLLGDAPQLDGKYTIFGRVIDSDETLYKIAHWPVDSRHQATVPLHILWAKVMPEPEAERQSLILAAASDAIPAPAPPQPPSGAAEDVFCGIVLISIGAFMFTRSPRTLLALHLLSLLLGMFGLMVLAQPKGPLAGGLAFIALVSVFRLMSAFENTDASVKK